MNTLPKPQPLDLAEILAELASEREELARIDAAIASAEGERQEIGQKRADIRNSGRDGSKVADAILADPDGANGMAALLAPDVESLDREFDAFTAAIRDLKARAQVTGTRIATLESEAFGALAVSVGPLVQALDARAKELAEGLVHTFADLQALRIATRAGAGETDRLAHVVRRLIGGPDPIAPHRKRLEISPDMTAALADIAGKLPGLSVPIVPNIFFE